MDELDEINDLAKAHKEQVHATAAIYHKGFVENPAGAKILEQWINAHCLSEPPSPDATQRECGMADGKRALVREIINQIQIITGE